MAIANILPVIEQLKEMGVLSKTHCSNTQFGQLETKCTSQLTIGYWKANQYIDHMGPLMAEPTTIISALTSEYW